MAFTGMVTSWKTVGQAGNTSPPHILFTIENLTGSGVTVYVRRLMVQVDQTATILPVSPQIKLHRFATPATSVGTTLTKGTFDTNQTSNTFVQCRSASSSDAANAPTTIAVPPGAYAWQQYGMRFHALTGQVINYDFEMLPAIAGDHNYKFKLVAGEGLAVSVITPVTTSNPATRHYLVNCLWEEV